MNFSALVAAASDPTAPVLPDSNPGATFSEFVSGVWGALTQNGYQTGVAIIVATIAVIAMFNLRTNRIVMVITGLGAFWAGWLGWNTVTGDNNALFPGQISARTLWDIAFASPGGFLAVVAVGCVTAAFLWRSSVRLPSRILLMVGAVLGASLIYNIFEAFRASTRV